MLRSALLECLRLSEAYSNKKKHLLTYLLACFNVKCRKHSIMESTTGNDRVHANLYIVPLYFIQRFDSVAKGNKFQAAFGNNYCNGMNYNNDTHSTNMNYQLNYPRTVDNVARASKARHFRFFKLICRSQFNVINFQFSASFSLCRSEFVDSEKI